MSAQLNSALKDVKTKLEAASISNTTTTVPASTVPNVVTTSTTPYVSQKELFTKKYGKRTQYEIYNASSWKTDPHGTFQAIFNEKIKEYSGGNMYFFVPIDEQIPFYLIKDKALTEDFLRLGEKEAFECRLKVSTVLRRMCSEHGTVGCGGGDGDALDPPKRIPGQFIKLDEKFVNLLRDTQFKAYLDTLEECRRSRSHYLVG